MDTQDGQRVRRSRRRPVGLVLLLVALALIAAAPSRPVWAAGRLRVPRRPALATARWRSPSRRPCRDRCRRRRQRPPMHAIEPDAADRGEVALATAAGSRPPDVWIPDARFWLRRPRGDPEVRTLARSVARTPVLLVGGPAPSGYASGAGRGVRPGERAGPVHDHGRALAVVAPQSEAAAVGRSPEAARQMIVPFAQTVQRAALARAGRGGRPWARSTSSPRLVVATEQQLAEAQPTRLASARPTPAVGARRLDFPLVVRRGAAPGSADVARACGSTWPATRAGRPASRRASATRRPPAPSRRARRST